jgi:type IV pilus assembly protein PilE
MNTVRKQDNRSGLTGQSGFTLIELVIAMVIAAILASIAIPSYSAYVQKSRRTDAKSALLDAASLEERFYSTNNTYSSSPQDLGYAVGSTSPVVVGNGYYTMAITVVPAIPPTSTTSGSLATYTLVATPIAGTTQASDTQCATFTLTSTGQQSSTGTSTTCWQ